jgi:hypothetical protein
MASCDHANGKCLDSRSRFSEGSYQQVSKSSKRSSHDNCTAIDIEEAAIDWIKRLIAENKSALDDLADR